MWAPPGSELTLATARRRAVTTTSIASDAVSETDGAAASHERRHGLTAWRDGRS